MTAARAIDADAVDVDLLTPMTRLWAREIGLEAVFVIADARGGGCIWCPKPECVEGTELERLIGHDLAVGFSKRFYRPGRQWLEVPKMDAAKRQIRDARIVKLKDEEGLSYDEIAPRVGLGRRRVIDIYQEQTGQTAANTDQAELEF